MEQTVDISEEVVRHYVRTELAPVEDYLGMTFKELSERHRRYSKVTAAAEKHLRRFADDELGRELFTLYDMHRAAIRRVIALRVGA